MRSIKDLLVAAKDASELMVDLAYAAVLFDDREIAREVIELADQMSEELFDLRRTCILAARSPEDADYFAGIVQVASAMEKIGDAAEDIARVVLKRLGVPHELRQDLRHADEVIGRVPLDDTSPLAGQALVQLGIPRETGLWVIAIKRDLGWIFAPQRDEVLHTRDVLYLQGSEDGLALFARFNGSPPDELEPPEWQPSSNLSVAVDLLVEMKNISEVAVGLAYSALLLHDKSLAAEVIALEDRTDQMHEDLEGWVLAAGRTELDPFELRGLLHIGDAAERITDAAQAMVWLVERDEELHPIVAEALAEADEVVGQFVVAEQSALANQTLGSTRVESETGMYVLAVQRGHRWRYRPRKGFVLLPADRIVATGPEDGIDLLAALAGAGT